MTSTIICAVLVIVAVTLLLVALLLVIKAMLTPTGTVKIDINNGKVVLDVPQGGGATPLYRNPGGSTLCGPGTRSQRGIQQTLPRAMPRMRHGNHPFLAQFRRHPGP